MKKLNQKTRGQGLVEYVALTALVAIVSIGTVKAFGGKVRSRLDQITKSFDKTVQQGLHGRSRSYSVGEDEDGEDESQAPRIIKLPGGVSLPRLPL